VNQIRVSWAPNPDIAWVEVWRSPGSILEAAVLVAVVEPGVFEYFDQGIHPGEIAHYWLQARNDAGTTPFTEALRGYGAIEVWVQWHYEDSSGLSAPALGLDRQVHVINEEGVLVTLDDQGTPAWTFAELSPPLNGPVVGLDGTVFVHNENELAAVRPDGTLRWRHPLRAGASTPIAVGWNGTTYLVQGNELTAINPEGTERWRTPVEVLTPPYLAVGLDDRLRVGTQYGTVALQSDGAFAQQITGSFGPMALAPDGALYIASPAYKLSAFEPTGAVRFNYARLNSRPTAHVEPVLGPDQRGYVSRTVGPLSDWIYAVDVQGQLLWEYPALASGLVADDSGGLIATMDHHVKALRPDGTLRWEYYLDGEPPTAPFLTEDGALCFAAGSRLVMLQTGLRPASSGWPMWRADAQRSGRTTASCRLVSCRWLENGDLELKFVGVADLTHYIEHSQDLEEWSVVSECLAVPGLTTIRLSLAEGEPCGFFRLRR
jgi:outer membrane protein assembly factor BamB